VHEHDDSRDTNGHRDANANVDVHVCLTMSDSILRVSDQTALRIVDATICDLYKREGIAIPAHFQYAEHGRRRKGTNSAAAETTPSTAAAAAASSSTPPTTISNAATPPSSTGIDQRHDQGHLIPPDNE
jgi:hypothetical protein